MTADQWTHPFYSPAPGAAELVFFLVVLILLCLGWVKLSELIGRKK